MKKYIFILLLFSCSLASAQLSVGDYQVQMIIDDKMSVRQSFDLLKKAVPLSMWFYDRYVIKDGVKYYRPGFTFMRRNKAFIVTDGDLIKVTI